MKEVWKGATYQKKDYSWRLEVSNLGRVRNANNGYIYSINIDSTEYYGTTVSLGSKDNKKRFRVHRLVAETFIKNIDDKPCINHIDGCKTNNCVDNLEWNTYKENAQHAINMGLTSFGHLRGEKSYRSHLTEDDVRYIRRNYKSRDKKFGSRPLGRRFNIDHCAILKIIKNVTWKHI